MTGTLSSRASCFRPRLISLTSWTRFASFWFSERLHQLQVVDDDQVQATLLGLEPPRLGAQLHDRQHRRVVDPHRRGMHVVHDLGDLRPVRLVNEPGLQRPRVDAALRGEEAQRQLLLAHLEREDADLLRLPHGGVLRDVQGQARLSDAGPRRQDDQVGRLEAAEQRVELRQAGRDAEDLAAVLVQVLQPVVGLAEQGGERLEAAGGAVLADLEQDPLGPVDGDLGVVRLLVADRRDLAGRADQVAQHRLALDDPAVVLDVHGGRHRVHEGRQVGRPADLLQPVAPGKLVAEGYQVDRLALAVQRQHRLVDVSVLLAVEVGRPQEVARPSGSASGSMRIEPSTLCSASTACGASLSMLIGSGPDAVRARLAVG